MSYVYVYRLPYARFFLPIHTAPVVFRVPETLKRTAPWAGKACGAFCFFHLFFERGRGPEHAARPKNDWEVLTMKHSVQKLLALLTALALAASLTACGGNSGTEMQTPAGAEPPASAAGAERAVNIAVTDTIGSLNPLLMDATEIVKYATSLVFLPLVELNADLEFEGQLAKEITTEDNRTFTIKLDENAAWSDGEPVTAQDVLFTFLVWASPENNNTGLNVNTIEGVGDDGYTEAGATEISGIRILDDKTLTVTTKWDTALYTFENNIGRYLLILPEHVLGEVPKDQLLTYAWFQSPDVISGPYFIADFDLSNYVHYVANENYWQGAPKIKYLNINVVDAAQILAGLQSGEIDLVQQTMGAIPLEDYDAVRALSNVTAVNGSAVTNQSIFINVENVPDVRIRQALLYGIDRETILNELVKGNGEIVDGFLVSASPYYDASLGVTEYDPDKAAALIAEAAADGTDTTITWHVNSGDETFVQAVQLIAAQFAELGLTIQIKTVDLANLMTAADSGEIQVMSVQYTYAPVDPYTDVAWLLSADGWTRYADEETAAALEESQSLTELNEITARYLLVDRKMQEDAPMISAYALSALGAVSNDLKGASPNVFGTFINVHQWEFAG